MHNTTGTRVDRPPYFPKPGSDQEAHLRSLLENASIEEREALRALFADAFCHALASKRQYYTGGYLMDARHGAGLNTASEVAKDYGAYLTHLADAE